MHHEEERQRPDTGSYRFDHATQLHFDYAGVPGQEDRKESFKIHIGEEFLKYRQESLAGFPLPSEKKVWGLGSLGVISVNRDAETLGRASRPGPGFTLRVETLEPSNSQLHKDQ